MHTYFGGSEQNIFRAYKHEIEAVKDEDYGVYGFVSVLWLFSLSLGPKCVLYQAGIKWLTGILNNVNRISEKLQSIFRASGLKVATQGYEYNSAGATYSGENVYSVIHAPRGDATEAIVLVAAMRTVDDEVNVNGVALALTLARYFKSMCEEYMYFDPATHLLQDILNGSSRVVSLVQGYHNLDYS